MVVKSNTALIINIFSAIKRIMAQAMNLYVYKLFFYGVKFWITGVKISLFIIVQFMTWSVNLQAYIALKL